MVPVKDDLEEVTIPETVTTSAIDDEIATLMSESDIDDLPF